MLKEERSLHLTVARQWWGQIIRKGDVVIDATCGNGHDTLFLSKLTLGEDEGFIWGFDIQPEAIAKTLDRLQNNLSKHQMARVHLLCQSHAQFPQLPSQPRCIVYNLGYLPGGIKTKTTRVETTLCSLASAMSLLQEGGIISVTCYPGHEEGQRETEAIEHLSSHLPSSWQCRWPILPKRPNAPRLLIMEKVKTSADHVEIIGL